MSDRFYWQVERLLVLVELMRGLRMPQELAYIHRALCDRMNSDYCKRTVRRDLETLSVLGLVEAEGRPAKYVFNLDSPLIAARLQPRRIEQQQPAEPTARVSTAPPITLRPLPAGLSSADFAR